MSTRNVIVFIIVMFIVAFEAGAQYCIKMSRSSDNTMFIVPAVILYSLVCGALYCSYEYRGMGIINAIWSALSVLAVTFVGMYFYHEEIRRKDMIGIALIFVGLYFIFVEGH
uniref:EamA domain-containing protein n=1 Tax=viral metagenome TaxID=1070528 RepID=A0A6C0IVG3_9ZZZZ